jgi:hypothetical protein
VAAADLDFVLIDNENFTSPEITIQNPDGTPRNLTGAGLRFQVRPCQGSPGSPLLDLSIGHGITVLSAINGKIQIAFGSFAVPAGDHFQDLIEDQSGYRTAIFQGRFEVTHGVTRWP